MPRCDVLQAVEAVEAVEAISQPETNSLHPQQIAPI